MYNYIRKDAMAGYVLLDKESISNHEYNEKHSVRILEKNNKEDKIPYITGNILTPKSNNN
jgi:hypothetical protein